MNDFQDTKERMGRSADYVNSYNKAAKEYGLGESVNIESPGCGGSGIMPAPREPQVKLWLENLASEIDALHNHISVLDDRLSGIMRIDAATKNAATKTGSDAPQQMLVPIADNIRSLCESIGMVNAHFSSILDRLEL